VVEERNLINHALLPAGVVPTHFYSGFWSADLRGTGRSDIALCSDGLGTPTSQPAGPRMYSKISVSHGEGTQSPRLRQSAIRRGDDCSNQLSPSLFARVGNRNGIREELRIASAACGGASSLLHPSAWR